MIHITIPIPPSVNNLYMTVRSRRVLTAAGRDYKDRVARATIAAVDDRIFPINARWVIVLNLYFKDNRRRDVDNCLKIVQDGAAAGLGIDDSAVDAAIALRCAKDASQPRCEVVIIPYIGQPLTLPALAAMLSEAA